MNSNDNDRNASGEGDDRPREYQYRYKYLHKYADSTERTSEHAGDPKQAADASEEDERRRRRADKDKDSESGDDEEKDEDDEDDEDDDDDDDASPEEKKKKKRKKIIIFSSIAAVLVLVALVWLLLYLFIFSKEASTDDAYVKGDMVMISPRVAGTVVSIAVKETDRVHAGQVLVRLDPVDAKVSLMTARGKLAQAVRDVQRSMAQAAEADSAVAQRRIQYELARDNYNRRHPLLKLRAVAKEDVDNSRRQMQADYAALKQAQEQAAAAHAQVDGVSVADAPGVVQARAQYRNAWINDERNAIVSPIDGYAARRQVQIGQRVQPGQDLLTVVPLDNLWVDANFKEGQLTNLRIGQPVEVVPDMYPDVTMHGKVVGLNAGTGSAFSLLPAQNASGNWIKVVQRLAVRISLKPDDLRKHPLRIGLSTSVTVDTHHRDGMRLSDTTEQQPATSTVVYNQEMRDADQQALRIIAANTLPSPAATRPARGK